MDAIERLFNHTIQYAGPCPLFNGSVQSKFMGIGKIKGMTVKEALNDPSQRYVMVSRVYNHIVVMRAVNQEYREKLAQDPDFAIRGFESALASECEISLKRPDSVRGYYEGWPPHGITVDDVGMSEEQLV